MTQTLPVRITIFSEPTNLPQVRLETERICRQLGFDEPTAGAIVLSVDEALTNIIRHAYHGACDQRIDIEYAAPGEPPEKLHIFLRDYGSFVDPRDIKNPGRSRLRPGGLGVRIISTCMDQVEYVPAEGGGTQLKLTKRIPSGVTE